LSGIVNLGKMPLNTLVAIQAACPPDVAFASCAGWCLMAKFGGLARARRKPPLPGLLLPGRLEASGFGGWG